MQWTDEGIVLGSKRHGEANAILEVMTCGHGRHLGLVRGGAGSKLRPVPQPGNRVSSTWRGGLDGHPGPHAGEALAARAGSGPQGPRGLNHADARSSFIAALLRDSPPVG